jgi:hypothetical protein
MLDFSRFVLSCAKAATFGGSKVVRARTRIKLFCDYLLNYGDQVITAWILPQYSSATAVLQEDLLLFILFFYYTNLSFVVQQAY